MATQAARRPKLLAPQDAIDDFWTRFFSKTPGRATTVIPRNQYAERIAQRNTDQSPFTTTQSSYDDAAAICRAKVDKIVKECRRINKKYRDPHFDLETDLKRERRDCLQSLSSIKDAKRPGTDFKPQSAKRVVEIFDNPQFYIDGPSADDVRQGRDGDCWLMAALCTLSSKTGLIEKLCVAHDQDVGVYGFVFHRDGEWISEIVDDFLYLTKADYDESYVDRVLFDELERRNPEEAYRKIYQANSGALYFASCRNPNETWLPLLEKCFAKAHGDYAALEGGFGGEAIEDLTGGVTSEIFTTDILDKEYFWREELLKVNQDFLFGCSTGVWGTNLGDRKGIVELHAYSIQKAVEIEGMRLIRLKNPWGKGEWSGPWSDGSKEWTPQWLEKLDHKFGDDGEFWISYDDLMRKYQAFERTRLFDSDWRVAQIWTTLTVPWTVDYHDTYFSFSMIKPGPVVIVLSQLDDRYFRGLQGQYRFQLAFRLHKAGHEDYVVRSQTPYRMRRSVNVELELEKGDYQVRIKVAAVRLEQYLPIEQVIRSNAKQSRDKLIRVGLAYDLAHGKGKCCDPIEELALKKSRENKLEAKEKQKVREKILSDREEAHYLEKKKLQREERKVKQKEAKEKKKNADPNISAHKFTAEELAKDSDKSDIENRVEEIASKTAEDPTPPPSPLSKGVKKRSVTFKSTTSKEGSEDSLSDLSERELDIQINAHILANKPLPPLPAEEDDLDEFEKDPWNAAIVVGLRVYHQIRKEEDVVKLKIVRSGLEGEGKGTGLDVDDSAKDATLEGSVGERRKSIIGG